MAQKFVWASGSLLYNLRALNMTRVGNRKTFLLLIFLLTISSEPLGG